MTKTQILLWKTTESKGLGLGLFYSKLAPLTSGVTYSRLYLDGKKNEEKTSDEQSLVKTNNFLVGT